MSGLTKSQWALLEFIQRELSGPRPVSPSYDEICTAMGWYTKSHVASQLAVLEAKGFIRWKPGRQRSIELADGPLMLVLEKDLRGALRENALARGITLDALIKLYLAQQVNNDSYSRRSVSRETSSAHLPNLPAAVSLSRPPTSR